MKRTFPIIAAVAAGIGMVTAILAAVFCSRDRY